MSEPHGLAEVEHDVYVVRDEDGAVLYVGCSSSVGSRLARHCQSPWFLDARSVTWEVYGTKREALDRELELIRLHQPRENTIGTEREWNRGGWVTRKARQAAAHHAGRRCQVGNCRTCSERAAA